MLSDIECKYGVRVDLVMAHSGEQAWDTVVSTQDVFDVVLVDHHLGVGMTGLEFATKFIEREPYEQRAARKSSTKVVVVSGDDLLHEHSSHSNKRIDFVMKPISRAKLISILGVAT
jgi:CheY-like chemotaxis protein